MRIWKFEVNSNSKVHNDNYRIPAIIIGCYTNFLYNEIIVKWKNVIIGYKKKLFYFSIYLLF